MKKSRKIGVIFWILALIIFFIFFGAKKLGFKVNLTHSAPVGIWQVTPLSNIEKGMLIEVCPPAQAIVAVMVNKGYLPSGSCKPYNATTILKPIAAIPGDLITIEPGQLIKINGHPVFNSYAKPGIPSWPAGQYIVQEGQVWVFSSYNNGSFDSRYFGPIEIKTIIGQAAPILIYGDILKMLKK